MLKRCAYGYFLVVSMWTTRGAFVEYAFVQKEKSSNPHMTNYLGLDSSPRWY